MAMWNKVKAAIKAAKDAVVKAFRWATGAVVSGAGLVFIGTGIALAAVVYAVDRTVAFGKKLVSAVAEGVVVVCVSVPMFVVAVVALLLSISGSLAVGGGIALMDGTSIDQDVVIDRLQSDLNRVGKIGKIVPAGFDIREAMELDSSLNDVEDFVEEGEWDNLIEVPKGLNHDVHDVGVVSYSDGKIFIKESEAQKKAPVQAPFFADIRKHLTEKGIEATDTDFQPAIGGTGYLDRCDAKDLAPWTFGHDAEGREYVVTPWIRVQVADMIRYGRVVIFQRYPSSNVIVQCRLEGYNSDLDLPYEGQIPFLAGIDKGKWNRHKVYFTFVDTAPELDRIGRPVV
jgi:hypothetical protein